MVTHHTIFIAVPENELITCLCVTRKRVPLLRRAVACFLAQTYTSRELIVVFESDDSATRDYLATLKDARIRPLEIPIAPKLSLGHLRNLSLKAVAGRYMAQWDDDDWYAPARLAEQIAAMRSSASPACVLSQWVMYDEVTGAAYLSQKRTWEGSLVAEVNAVAAYADFRRGEDTPAIAQMEREGKLLLLDNPWLYVYVYHGQNTWERGHWRRVLVRNAQPLTAAQTGQVRLLLHPAGAA